MSQFSRRKFLRNSLAAGGGYFLFQQALSRLALSQTGKQLIVPESIYGPLSPTAAANTGEVLLSLPGGFQYNVFGKTGAPMSDSRPTPKAHDGMGVFAAPGGWTIVRNHEIQDFAGTGGTIGAPHPYDQMAGGGTTTLMIDKTTRLPVGDFVSSGGTVRNCSGGVTPWNTWITCEETTLGVSSGFARPHGYCFEVVPTAISSGSPVALTGMGRFRHEGAAVDRKTGAVYLTEDNPAGNSGFYRFIPNSYGRLAQGGKLQMLSVRGQPHYDTRTGQIAGSALLADWVDIADPDPAAAETNPAAVFDQGWAAGGAAFARLEGCIAEFDRIIFISTTGGDHSAGQVWEYRHRKGNSGRLKLLYESPSTAILNMPDNVLLGLKGNIFMAEDNGVENYLRILTPAGAISDFAKNVVPGFTNYEFTGCCFSPDRTTLFVNIQTPGMTFAVWGPW